MTVRTAGRPMTAAALLNTVRAHGLRVSLARRRVLEALLAAERPLTAEEIAASPSDVGSVYRNLDALESIGLVRHVHLGHGPGRYALAERAGGWATCEGCGRSTPLSPGAVASVRAAVRDACGFDATFAHFPIAGRCPDCA